MIHSRKASGPSGTRQIGSSDLVDAMISPLFTLFFKVLFPPPALFLVEVLESALNDRPGHCTGSRVRAVRAQGGNDCLADSLGLLARCLDDDGELPHLAAVGHQRMLLG